MGPHHISLWEGFQQPVKVSSCPEDFSQVHPLCGNQRYLSRFCSFHVPLLLPNLAWLPTAPGEGLWPQRISSTSARRPLGILEHTWISTLPSLCSCRPFKMPFLLLLMKFGTTCKTSLLPPPRPVFSSNPPSSVAVCIVWIGQKTHSLFSITWL